MPRKKDREIEIFSMSFLDVITCGFGAILLIFILTTGKRADVHKDEISELQVLVGKLERDVETERKEIERLARSAATIDENIRSIRDQTSSDQQRITARQQELMAVLRQLAELEEALARMIALKKEIPTVEEPPPLPIPNVAKRHYLSGFNLRGEFIMFLLEASGGMLADTIDGAVTETGKPPEERREAEKWQRAVRSVKWMIGNLPPNARFQIYIFNAETKPLIESTKGQWIQPGNRKAVAEMVGKLDELVPSGPANLERAFSTIRFMDTIPDSLVLFTDGLPTTSDSMAVSGNVDADTRVRLFRLAQRQLPPRVPVNTILFPMEGDPAAAMLFWEMGVSTRGALVSPAKHWPET